MTSLSTSRHPDDGGPHVRVSVFVGPDPDHRALAGVLTFRKGEDDEFILRVEDRYLRAEVERLRAGIWSNLHILEVAGLADWEQNDLGDRLRSLLPEGWEPTP